MAESPLPASHEWVFSDRKGEAPARTYTQSELTIDGEVQLFQLLNRTIGALNEAEFPWGDLRETLQTAEEDGIASLDWGAIAKFLTIALSVIPNLAAEAAAIMLGIFPTNEDGQPNRAYDADVRFVRGDLNIARLVDMLKVFVAQNEYERLALPFANALRREVMTGVSSTDSPSVEGTPPTSMSSSLLGTARRATSRGRPVGEASTSP